VQSSCAVSGQQRAQCVGQQLAAGSGREYTTTSKSAAVIANVADLEATLEQIYQQVNPSVVAIQVWSRPRDFRQSVLQ